MPELDVKFVVTSTERGEPQLALLLEGLTDLPPDPRFSILPADDSRALELGPAPEDLNAPCSVTREAHGIVLGVGDHIGERLRLRPGQTVVVELPGIGVRTIAEWPGHLTQHVPAPAMPTEAPPAGERSRARRGRGPAAGGRAGRDAAPDRTEGRRRRYGP